MVANGLVSWSSKKQKTVALSSTEAEYMASTRAAQEAIWMKGLLKDLGETLDGAVTVMEDNQGSIALANNPSDHARTKHIDIRHHFIRQLVEENRIVLDYCPTEDMVADIFTKALARDRHVKLCKLIGLVDRTALP
jgi:hypothetical protein